MEAADVYAQWPVLSLVAFVAIAVLGVVWKVWNELKNFQAGEAEKWRSFIKTQGDDARAWNDRSQATTQAWQLEMANTITRLADKIDSLENATVKMAGAMDSITGYLVERNQPAPPRSKSKAL